MNRAIKTFNEAFDRFAQVRQEDIISPMLLKDKNYIELDEEKTRIYDKLKVLTSEDKEVWSLFNEYIDKDCEQAFYELNINYKQGFNDGIQMVMRSATK